MSVITGVDDWAALRRLPRRRPACPRGAFLVSPDGFAIAAESTLDNSYMQTQAVDGERARRQHRALQQALAGALPTVCFPGSEATPDAVFPNNVFATARDRRGGRLLIGSMRHPVRRREADRADIRGFFTAVLGYHEVDLRSRPGLSELTGTLVIDRARGLGLAGLSPRCDPAGVLSMQEAFGLAAVAQFALAAGEYHSNVVLSVLASRALVISPAGLADPAAAAGLIDLYAPAVIELDRAEQQAFAANCIALEDDRVWLSERAADGLRAASRAAFERLGFRLGSVALDEIEKAGGSLRCCVGEIY